MSYENIIFRLKADMANSYRTLAVFILIFIVLMIIVIYCIINIVKIINFWIMSNASIESVATSNNIHVSDNEVYINSDATPDSSSDYKMYTDNINKSVSEFKMYNEKLKAFYKDNKPGESPQDLLDKSMLASTSDNYS